MGAGGFQVSQSVSQSVSECAAYGGGDAWFLEEHVRSRSRVL